MTTPGLHCPRLFCVVCGAEFRVHPYRLTTARVCSRDCGAVLAGWGRSRKRYLGVRALYRKHCGRRVHRLTMEAALGRRLIPEEIVHHMDGNPRNNRLENLRVVTKQEHAELHEAQSGCTKRRRK